MSQALLCREFHPLGHGDCFGKGIPEAGPVRAHTGAFVETGGKVKHSFILGLNFELLRATLFGKPA